MVRETIQGIIQPHNECSCCHKVFHQGDQAVVVTRIPSLDYETLCLSDWAVILASSTAWLDSHDNLGPEGLKTLIRDTLTLCIEDFDSQAREWVPGENKTVF